MDEKYFFALIGIALGSFLTAIFSITKELFIEGLHKKKEAEYLAIRLVCIFEAFIEECGLVSNDNGLCYGQTDQDGYHRIQEPDPKLDIELDNVNWKSLSPELMYEVLYFPALVKNVQGYVRSSFEFDDPPDYSEAFQERQLRYSILGLRANELVLNLREKYNISNEDAGTWNVIDSLKSTISNIENDKKKKLSNSSNFLNENA